MNIRKNFPIILLFVLVLAAFLVAPAAAQGETPPVSFTVSALTLVTIVSGLLSLVLDYAPGIAARYEALSVAQKRGVALLIAVIIVVGSFGLTCYNIVNTNLLCSPRGAWDALSNIIYVFAVGQGFHAGTKPTSRFKNNTLRFPPK